MKNEDNKITIIDDEGNEVLCDVLLTFKSDEFNKNYVLFYETGFGEKDDEEVEVMAASYVEQEDGTIGELFAVEDEKEMDLISEVLDSFNNEDECDDDCCCDCDDDCECEEEEEHHCCCHKCKE